MWRFFSRHAGKIAIGAGIVTTVALIILIPPVGVAVAGAASISAATVATSATAVAVAGGVTLGASTVTHFYERNQANQQAAAQNVNQAVNDAVVAQDQFNEVVENTAEVLEQIEGNASELQNVSQGLTNVRNDVQALQQQGAANILAQAQRDNAINGRLDDIENLLRNGIFPLPSAGQQQRGANLRRRRPTSALNDDEGPSNTTAASIGRPLL